MEDQLWYTIPTAKVLSRLHSQKNGLSSAEAQTRLAQLGPNRLPEERPLPGFVIFITQFKSPLVYVLLGAAGISALLRDWIDIGIILAAVLMNVALGFYQETKANRAIVHLKKLIDFQAKVLRDGREISTSSKTLVPGDIIFLSAGDKITADARLLEVENFQVIEAALTGESAPSDKKATALKPGINLADRENMVYSGTVVASGRATAIVCETGLKTEIGKITQLIEETNEEPTPLQLQITKLGRILTVVVLSLAVLIVVIGSIQGRPIIVFGDEARSSMLLIASAVAVSAIPEGLLIAITVILSLGMQTILRRKALVRRLIAAETLGSVSIICTDKTGTLTEGRMDVEQIITATQSIDVKKMTDVAPSEGLSDHALITKISLLCSNAVIENPAAKLEDWKIIADPTERALVLAAVPQGVTRERFEKNQPRLMAIPFNSEKKWMATLNRLDSSHDVIYVKGAPEKIIAMASAIRINGKKQPLTANKKVSLEQKYEALTGQGLRLLAFGYKKIEAGKKITNLEEQLTDITFVGLAALKDPLRPETKETFELTKQAGIRPIIVTGDHRLTAQAIVAELGLKVNQKNILEGQDLDQLSDEELKKKVTSIDIYARVEPRHKLRIIAAWQSRGEVVAMTGDGVNDAPALKAADVGLALGSGSDVAKETADIILLDNNFKTIVAAIEQGRIIFENIRKVVLYLLSDSFTEVILIVGALLLKLPIPILPAQIFWINIVDDGLLGLAMTTEPGEPEIMRDKPRKKNQPIVNREIKTLIFIISVITTILLLILFYLLYRFTDYDIAHLRTLIFTALAIDSLLYVFSCRSLRHSVFSKDILTNKFLIVSVVVCIILQIAAVYEPHLQKILDTTPLNFNEWLIVMAVAAFDIFAIEIAKRHFIIKRLPT